MGLTHHGHAEGRGQALPPAPRSVDSIRRTPGEVWAELALVAQPALRRARQVAALYSERWLGAEALKKVVALLADGAGSAPRDLVELAQDRAAVALMPYLLLRSALRDWLCKARIGLEPSCAPCFEGEDAVAGRGTFAP